MQERMLSSKGLEMSEHFERYKFVGPKLGKLLADAGWFCNLLAQVHLKSVEGDHMVKTWAFPARHGGVPIAGWFIVGKNLLIRMEENWCTHISGVSSTSLFDIHFPFFGRINSSGTNCRNHLWYQCFFSWVSKG